MCVSAHVALRMLLAFSQPVNCIFWPIITLNWLVAASKLHKHTGGHVALLIGPTYCPFAILWFSFKRCFIDGVSCVKFWKQFLNNMNEIANGATSEQEIPSLLPYFHDIITRTRPWHLLLINFILI